MKEIELTQGKVALVDDADYQTVSQYKWHAEKADNGWYAKTTIDLWGQKRSIRMQQILCAFKKVDHIDRDGLNNQRSNLRVCTHRQNLWNAGRLRTSKSPFKGIAKARRGNWFAQIFDGAKNRYLGSFPTPREAALAYDKASIELRGSFAVTNKSLGLL